MVGVNQEYIRELEKHFQAKAVIIDISCISEIQKRVIDVSDTEYLNNTQKYLTKHFYEFSKPDLAYDVQSVLLFAFPFPARALAGFTIEGKLKTFPVCLENRAQYEIVSKELNGLLGQKGYHAQFMPKLPRKLIAVSSGLAKYGRNNIAYVDGLGSFVSFLPFYTDIPTDNHILYPAERMSFCNKCSRCVTLCPTQAIRPNFDIIDSERCLTYFNEKDSNEVTFPDWVNPKVHNSVIGCEVCQINCPQNKAFLANEKLVAVFDETETELLCKGTTYENLSGPIKEKVDALNIGYLLSALPRNLKLLLSK